MHFCTSVAVVHSVYVEKIYKKILFGFQSLQFLHQILLKLQSLKFFLAFVTTFDQELSLSFSHCTIKQVDSLKNES